MGARNFIDIFTSLNFSLEAAVVFGYNEALAAGERNVDDLTDKEVEILIKKGLLGKRFEKRKLPRTTEEKIKDRKINFRQRRTRHSPLIPIKNGQNHLARRKNNHNINRLFK